MINLHLRTVQDMHDFNGCAFVQVGYILNSCLLNENHDFLRLVINTVRNDIIGGNETFQCLALTMVRSCLGTSIMK